MLYSIHINQVKLIEWNISINEAITLDWLTKRLSGFKMVIIGSDHWYWASRNMATQDIPCVSEKSDTIYRIYKSLQEKGLIEYEKDGKKDLIRLTEKALEWHIKKSEYSDDHSSIENSHSKKHENSSEKSTDERPTNYNKNSLIDNELIDNYKNKSNSLFLSELDILIDVFNDTMGTRVKNTGAVLQNYIYWRKYYEPKEIEFAIRKINHHDFWKNRMTFETFFRQKNTAKEPVNYISDMLNFKESGVKADMNNAFKESFDKIWNE